MYRIFSNIFGIQIFRQYMVVSLIKTSASVLFEKNHLPTIAQVARLRWHVYDSYI
ncbi:hypothetical protein CEV31_0256 [Brucella thiophenivorans]|uniref:Uncharacterized protein n=1 Tax=Brucella thiophenivorans TaxID=571255 RepID=A0A256G5E8_9HYPH|nr:hypothetical protein CEV31_0256 [Brucella thiophenivorans]